MAETRKKLRTSKEPPGTLLRTHSVDTMPDTSVTPGGPTRRLDSETSSDHVQRMCECCTDHPSCCTREKPPQGLLGVHLAVHGGELGREGVVGGSPCCPLG